MLTDDGARVYDSRLQAGFGVVTTHADKRIPRSGRKEAAPPTSGRRTDSPRDRHGTGRGAPALILAQRQDSTYKTKRALYDTGRYATLDKVWPRRYEELRKEQEAGRGPTAREGARHRRLQLTWRSPPATAPTGDSQSRRCPTTGRDRLNTGSTHGQGHHAAWAMLEQEELGIPDGPGHVNPRRHGPVPVGVGTMATARYSSARSAVYKRRSRSRRGPAQAAACSRRPRPTWCSTRERLWQVAGDPIPRCPGQGWRVTLRGASSTT